jgi:hypothetical protein
MPRLLLGWRPPFPEKIALFVARSKNGGYRAFNMSRAFLFNEITEQNLVDTLGFLDPWQVAPAKGGKVVRVACVRFCIPCSDCITMRKRLHTVR